MLVCEDQICYPQYGHLSACIWRKRKQQPMSEQRPQNWYLPLRVRFRSPAEQTQHEHETAPAIGGSQALRSHVVGAATDPDAQRRTQQIKELIRLGNILRAELGLNEVLQQIVASISACTGFRISVINLVEDSSDKTSPVAFAGASEEGQRMIKEKPLSVDQMHRFMS